MQRLLSNSYSIFFLLEKKCLFFSVFLGLAETSGGSFHKAARGLSGRSWTETCPKLQSLHFFFFFWWKVSLTVIRQTSMWTLTLFRRVASCFRFPRQGPTLAVAPPSPSSLVHSYSVLAGVKLRSVWAFQGGSEWFQAVSLRFIVIFCFVFLRQRQSKIAQTFFCDFVSVMLLTGLADSSTCQSGRLHTRKKKCVATTAWTPLSQPKKSVSRQKTSYSSSSSSSRIETW